MTTPKQTVRRVYPTARVYRTRGSETYAWCGRYEPGPGPADRWGHSPREVWKKLEADLYKD